MRTLHLAQSDLAAEKLSKKPLLQYPQGVLSNGDMQASSKPRITKTAGRRVLLMTASWLSKEARGTQYLTCPQCGWENEMEVDLGEHFVDVPDECINCSYIFHQDEKDIAYTKALENMQAHATESAMDSLEDR